MKLQDIILKYGLDNLIRDLSSHSRMWVYQHIELSEKQYYKLIKDYDIKPIKVSYSYYTNGEKDIKVYNDCDIPNGYILGRTNYGKGTKGYHWYTNGVDNKFLSEYDEIPNGYHLGNCLHTTTGYIFVNNGTNTICVSKDKVPDGYIYKGKLNTENYKKSASKRKVFYYNNGCEEIKLKLGDSIPSGFVEGKLLKKTPQERILERDQYYDSLGFIAIKNLSIKQRTAYQYYRDCEKFKFDSIHKEDSYTYINKKHLAMLDDYCSVNHSLGTSNKEQLLLKYIKSIYDGEVISNCKSILKYDSGYYEMDIYIPDKKIGIEFNGNFWHDSEHKDKNYHINKSKLADKLGIRLIHIYEYEWDNIIIQNKIKLMLKIALGCVNTKIYARQCEVKKITNKKAKALNDMVHLQGHRNAQVTYGLFYNNELVQLMSFSKTKYNKNLKDDNSWEIIRGCPGSNNVVIGGVSKLFKHFIEDYNPREVFSYCDFNKFNGKSYEIIGMKFIGYTGPDMKWVLKDDSVVNRKPSKHKELKEQAIAQIFGSGSKKYLWKKEGDIIE